MRLSTNNQQITPLYNRGSLIIMNIIAIRLLSQQLGVPQFSDSTQVIAHMGAMLAQKYRMRGCL
jgi:hypothetical protein